MTDKPDLATESVMTPEAIAANGFFSRAEKLDRLRELKHELGSRAQGESESLDEIERDTAAINAAIAEVKRDQTEDDSGTIIGRAPSA